MTLRYASFEAQRSTVENGNNRIAITLIAFGNFFSREIIDLKELKFHARAYPQSLNSY
jgi:hypothetical protein